MLKNLSIKARVIAGFLVILFIGFAGITPVVISGMHNLVDEAEQRELTSLSTKLLQSIEAEQRLALALATLVSEMPGLNTYLAEENRSGLNAELQNAFLALKADYGLRQFQYHTPPATSWLRVHRPEKFGDDLTGFRKTLVEANASVSKVEGLEGGVAGLGIRGVVPVKIDGDHWGSVEMGFALNDAFFESFRNETGADVGMYLLQDGQFQTYESTYSESALIEPELARQAMQGEPAVFPTEYQGKPVTVYAMPASDFSGTPIGIYEIVMDRSDYVASLTQSKLLAGGVMLACGVIALLVAGLVVRSITQPLAHMNQAMANVASGEGDLTQRLPIEGRNELTKIADNFNTFIAHLEDVMRTLNAATQRVSHSSIELLESSQSSHAVADQQRRETTEVATAMNEMSATAQEIARSAETAASLSIEADSSADQGQVVVGQTISTIQSLSEDVRQTSEVVNQVNRQSREINTILEVIQEIAEQTNLLALNAAIEAARAGEQGRGFAVVADEVRALAARTHQSTDEIHRMISDLQNGTDKTVEVIDKSWERAKETVEDADKAGQALNDITVGMDSIRDMTAQIASASEEQTSVSEMINQRVDTINEGANRNLEAAQRILDETAKINQELNQLSAVVGKFKIGGDLQR